MNIDELQFIAMDIPKWIEKKMQVWINNSLCHTIESKQALEIYKMGVQATLNCLASELKIGKDNPVVYIQDIGVPTEYDIDAVCDAFVQE